MMKDVVAVVLAAGLGKRMGSDLPKVLLPFHGRPMVNWVIESAREAGIGRIIVVVGHKGELVVDALSQYPLEFVWQHELLGTGHAVMQARPLVESHSGPVLVLLGDVPGLRPETIRGLIETHSQAGAAATILSADVPDPSGYGRIVRSPDGQVEAIVESRDASGIMLSIKEINTGLIAFDCQPLLAVLGRLGRDNAQGEYYLTDAVKILVGEGHTVLAHKVDKPEEGAGVNSYDQLNNLQRLISPDSLG